MILVKAIDCFLYGYTMVNTGNKVHVEEKDIPKLIRAGKIGPENMPDSKEEPEANRDSMGYRLDKTDKEAPRDGITIGRIEAGGGGGYTAEPAIIDIGGRAKYDQKYPASKRKSKRKK